ncbi:MAG TPA: hypothetical protein VF747_09345 [Blastocatellia bacterium]
MLVVVAELACTFDTFIVILSFVGFWSKFVPDMVKALPPVTICGLNPVIAGAPEELVTVKGVLHTAAPVGGVTLTVPVVAPDGTVAMICVTVAELTVAATPLKLTVSSPAIGLKPVPLMVTDARTGPLPGLMPMTDTVIELWREMDRTLPTAS